MVRENAIEVEGAIVEVLSTRTYRVRLENGHQLMAYAVGRAQQTAAPRAPGDRVRVRLSYYDLSVGRIIV